MARDPAQLAYYVDPERPQCPIHAKVHYAKRMGLRRIAEAEANALSAALRGGPDVRPEPVPEPQPATATAAEQEGPALPPTPTGMPLLDGSRRMAASEIVKRAAADACRVTNEQQVRYELALQARNRNLRATLALHRRPTFAA